MLLHEGLPSGLRAGAHRAWVLRLLLLLLMSLDSLDLLSGRAGGPLVGLERLLDQLLLRRAIGVVLMTSLLAGLHLFDHVLELDLHLVLLQVLLL